MPTPSSASRKKKKGSSSDESIWSTAANENSSINYVYLKSDSFHHEAFLKSSVYDFEYLRASNGILQIPKLHLVTPDSICTYLLSNPALSRSLFIDSQLMAAVGWSFGTPVILNGSQIFRVWPLSISTNFHAVFAGNDVPIQDNVTIKTLTKNVRLSQSVSAKIIKTTWPYGASLSDFESIVRNYLSDIFFFDTEVLRIPFFGPIVDVRIENVLELSDLMKEFSLEPSDPIPYSFSLLETSLDIIYDQLPDEVEKKNIPTFVGYSEEISSLREVLSSSKRSGVLLYGPSGTGKTVLGRTIGNSLGLKTVVVSSTELYSKYYGETENRLRSLFERCSGGSPTLLFLDDLDSLCPKKDISKSDQEKRVMVSLGHMMDEFKSGPKILAASNAPDFIDPHLRRPGRLDFEIEIGVPSTASKVAILSHYCSLAYEKNVEVSEAFSKTLHGYVGADIEALAFEAAENSILPIENSLRKASSIIRPSAMKEITITVPDVSWKDIGGLNDLKVKLQQSIEWPLSHPEAFERLGISAPKGLLMYGPPGCSKTMIAKALANKSGLNFIAVKGPELLSKWVGESEKAVRSLFLRARRVAPSIIFFDEIDSLCSSRGGGESKVGDRVLAQLLTEMDGIEALKSVVVIAATNRPDMIDDALLRPGRLDRVVYVPLPDIETRRKILEIHTRKTPLSKDVLLDDLAKITEGYSGAEIAGLTNEAALKSLEEDISSKCVNYSHFQMALEIVKPRIRPELLKIYDNFSKNRKK